MVRASQKKSLPLISNREAMKSKRRKPRLLEDYSHEDFEFDSLWIGGNSVARVSLAHGPAERKPIMDEEQKNLQVVSRDILNLAVDAMAAVDKSLPGKFEFIVIEKKVVCKNIKPKQTSLAHIGFVSGFAIRNGLNASEWNKLFADLVSAVERGLICYP